MGPYHERLCWMAVLGILGAVCTLFGLRDLSKYLFVMMLGFILLLSTAIWLLVSFHALVRGAEEVARLRQDIKDCEDLFREGYLTWEEFQNRCEKAKKEIWKV